MNKNLILVLVLLAGGGYYAYSEFYPQYENWEGEIEKLQQNMDKARQSAPKLIEIRQEEERLQDRLNKSLAKLPSGAQLDDLLTMVMPVFENVGITPEQIGARNVEAAAPKDIFRIHALNFNEVKGLTMEQVIRLLFEMRTFNRIINVVSFNLVKAPDKPGIYDLNMKLETYSYIESDSGPVRR